MKCVPFDRTENGIRNEEAAQRPTSFLWFLVLRDRTGVTIASGCGKVGNLLLVFHFPMAVKPGGGNVEISRFLRDFQGTVEGVGKLFLLFHSFHGPGISTARGSVIGTAVVAETGLCIAATVGTWRRSSGGRTLCRSSPSPLAPGASSSCLA